MNAKGEVIGINTVKVNADAVEGMGYAIPISDVTDVINDLMNRQTRTKVDESERGALGISGTDVDSQSAQVYNMPEGVFISDVTKDGGAEKAGVREMGRRGPAGLSGCGWRLLAGDSAHGGV